MTQAPKQLLIIEDDPGLLNQLKWCFAEDIEVSTADTPEKAIHQLRLTPPQVITLDLGLPPDPGGVTEGFALLKKILSFDPACKVIVMTGQESREHALKAIELGAYDYYQKPLDQQTLNFVVQRAFNLASIEAENKALKEVTPIKHSNIITNSPNMLQLCRTIEKVAPTDLGILVQGETGTGKELVARGLHQASKRASQPFNAINCAAIPENLLESELFGYEKGAFTGAHKQQKGRLELTNKGTLFLDEIGDMPMALQAKLLRVIQEKTIERIGSHQPIQLDVRIICATHRNLEDMIANNEFREDLYYRISEITLELPPLRERTGDAMLLAHALLSQFAPELNAKVKGFHASALEAIHQHAWPGNVRELINKIKRAIILADGNLISEEDLGLKIGEDNQETPFNLKTIRDDAERHAVVQALSACDFNLSQTARLLGVTRPTLYNLMERLNIPSPESPSSSD